MTLDEVPARLRWPRGQRFALSSKGHEAAAAYRDSMVAARSVEGRASFDAAQKAWAQTHGLGVDDGLYLAELASRPLTLREIIAALDTCGKTRADAIAALERLADAGMLSVS